MITIIPILQMRKLRPWEINGLAQDPEEPVFTSKLCQLLCYSLPVFDTLLPNAVQPVQYPDLWKRIFLISVEITENWNYFLKTTWF